MYTALRLLRKLRDGEAEVTVVDPRSYMTYQPFLPEAAAGIVQPRHVVVPLRRVLRRRRGRHRAASRRVDHAAQGRARCSRSRARPYEIAYDSVVVAAGSIARTLPIPGLAEKGIGFKNVEEAIQLRNQVIECLDIAESTHDPDIRARNLHLRLRRRRLRRASRRSASSRTWPGTPPATTARSSRATCAGCSSRRPTGSCPRSARTWAATPLDQLRKRGIDCRLEHPARVVRRRPRRAVRRRGVRHRDDRVDRGRQAQPARRRTPASRSTTRAGSSARRDAAGRGRRGRLGRRRLRARSPTSPAARRDHVADGPARGPAGQGARRQHRRDAARPPPKRVPAQVRRVGRLARPLQGRGAGLRHQAQGLPGLVHAPDLPREPGADLHPQGRRCSSTGRWRCSSAARSSRCGAMHEPFEEFQEAAGTPPPPPPKV